MVNGMSLHPYPTGATTGCQFPYYGQTYLYGGKEQESEPKKEKKLELKCAV